jgi:hypothetical protein
MKTRRRKHHARKRSRQERCDGPIQFAPLPLPGQLSFFDLEAQEKQEEEKKDE